MRTVSVAQRRNLVVRRHHLGGDAGSAEAVTRAVLALHATDPASVYLSVLARSADTTLADVGQAMYDRRSLLRWMAMRRTLFLFPREDVPVVHAAVSVPVAQALRRQLLARLGRNGSQPPVHGELDPWLHDVQDQVEDALARRGKATGAELATDVPALRTVITPRARSDRPQALTSPLLTVMAAQGRLLRGAPTGAWTSRHHRWEPVSTCWPEGMPVLDAAQARRALARRYLSRFGPATASDLQWWTGWGVKTVRDALTDLPLEEVDLDGQTGLVLADDDLDEAPPPPLATLLPALDPTPMGWKQRAWFLGVEHEQLFDRAGNIGPTIWWDGEVIGSWAIAPTGDLRTAVSADRGAEAAGAVEHAAARLHERLDGTVITPAARTPLERSLARD